MEYSPPEEHIHVIIKLPLLSLEEALSSEGGFAKVYSANWIDAYIKGWDQKTKNWKRKERKKVALKVLEDSSRDISKTFLNELEALVKLAELSITGGKLFIVPLYGISQDPDTKNFILVFKYIENNSKLDYKTIEDVYSTFVSLSLDSRSQANYKSRLLDLPDLSELESELAPDSMQISTGEIESRSRAVSALEAANLVPFNNIHLDIRQVHPMRCLYNRRP
ncbi:unnamed protein product [Rhizophagus irregularis]|nr:unnamed protein product [Rhizophagus irregularis]